MPQRLRRVRRHMGEENVDALLIRSTDRYLNEYVPLEESARVWVTGFTGSMGEALITSKAAFLFVDGRYWLQAEREVDPKHWTIERVQLGGGLEEAVATRLRELAERSRPKKLRIGFEPDRLTPNALGALQRAVGERVVFQPLLPSPVDQARGPEQPAGPEPRIRALDEKRVGFTVQDKLEALRPKLETLGVQALLVQRLDEIAYLTNLRGQELPFQATFKSIALVTPKALFVGLEPSRVPSSVRTARHEVRFVAESELWTLIGKGTKHRKVGIDPDLNTEHARLRIRETGAKVILVPSPIPNMKAKKNSAEMKAMQDAFHRADHVVERAIRWALSEVQKGRRVSEASFARRVENLFIENGATGLSFQIISAAGKNGAIIHYSNPSPRRYLRAGELMLVDTGAYFEEGYATDLTRTFLVGSPQDRGSAEQRRIYTLVLKAAIAGMKAVIPERATGEQLDAIIRAPLWAEGLDYNHGTGHGVGINVHEYPPRISPRARTSLEPGHVFSIEPGLYLPKFGGVRIENLCTVEPATKRPGFLEVKPLTFSPLDRRLIEAKMLTLNERTWLSAYQKRHRSRPSPQKDERVV